MRRRTEKFGTDSRYLNWSGARLDRGWVNAATALAAVLSWGALAYVHLGLISADWSAGAVFGYFVAGAICVGTSFLIQHPDRVVSFVARGFASGIPLAFLLVLAGRSLLD